MRLTQACVFEKSLWCLFLLEKVLSGYRLEHVLLGSLLNLTADQELVQHEVGLLKVEDDIKLAHTAEILVQKLDVSVDDFQRQELVVATFDCATKVETSVSFVHDLEILPLEERAHLGFSGQDVADQLPRDLLLLLLRNRGVPLLQSALALSAEE